MFSFKVGDLVTFEYKFNEYHNKTIGTITKIHDSGKELADTYPSSIFVDVLTNNGKVVSCFSGDLLSISLNENKTL